MVDFCGSPSNLTAQDIAEYLDRLVGSSDLQPVKDSSGSVIRTFCNIAVRRYLNECFGYPNFGGPELMDPGMNADEICEYLASHGQEWESMDSAEIAKSFVDIGDAVILAHPYSVHGHVAIAYPCHSLVFSGKWDRNVLMIANVGESTGIMGANFAFPVSDTPPLTYRLLNGRSK